MTPPILRRLPAWVVNGVTVTLGLALVQVSIGLAAGSQAAQAAIATAVCASLADVVTTTARVARRVLVAAIASTAAGTLFLAVRPYPGLLLPAVVLIVFGAMLLLAWGPKAGSVSFAAALALVFSMSLPASYRLSWEHVGWGLAGSAGYWLWAVATAWLLQPTWRNFALASAAAGEARLFAAVGKEIGAPKGMIAQSGILEEEASFAEGLQNARDIVFANDQGPDAQRETAILLHLIDLRDLVMASNVEAGLSPPRSATHGQAALSARIVQEFAGALGAVAEHLRSGAGPVADARVGQAIRAVLDEAGQGGQAGPCAVVPRISELLRNKLELLASLQRLLTAPAAIPAAYRRVDLRRYISPDEWRLDSVWSNLRPGTPVFRHALRTAVTAGLAYWIARFSPWMLHPQWIILTITAVMQGSLAQTLLRRNARILGTLAGCVVVAVLTAFPSEPFLSGCFLVAAGVAHAYLGVQYSVTAGGAAIMAVLQPYLAAPAAGFGTVERFADTVAGALLGWAATYALPIWERKALPAVLQRTMSAMRAYAAEATALRDDPAASPRLVRQQAYDGLRAVAAIRTRSLAEPARQQVPPAALTAWLAAAYGVMAGLSNVRLTLTLHRGATGSAEFAAAMEVVTRRLDRLLDGAADQAAPASAPDDELERALAPVPHLAARVRHTLDEAARVARGLAQLRAQ